MRDHKMTKVKNNARRRRKLRVRKLRYSCQWKIHAAKFNGGKLGGVDEANSENGGSESSSPGESNTMIIELGVSSGSVEGVREGGEARVSVSDIVPYSEISIIGRRREMEDEVRVKLVNKTKYDFFAVYDGHGGAQVAEVCRKRLHEIVAEEISERGEREEDVVEWERLMDKSFERMDEEVNDGDASMKTVGTTVVAAVIGLKEVVVANCGDCRAVLGRDGVALALSNDHKPGSADELKRIESAGGRVINWNGYRVLGVLATSRSIGDEYLKPFVISKPEVTVTKRTNNDEFLILGSDGLWDVVSNETACNVVRRCFGGNMKRISLKTANSSYVAEAAAVLAELAVARGSKDNISVIVIDLRKATSSPP